MSKVTAATLIVEGDACRVELPILEAIRLGRGRAQRFGRKEYHAYVHDLFGRGEANDARPDIGFEMNDETVDVFEHTPVGRMIAIHGLHTVDVITERNDGALGAMPLKAIAEYVRNKGGPSPSWREVIDDNRRHHDSERQAFRTVVRGIIDDFQHRMAQAANLNPRAFAQVPDEALDQFHIASQAAKALEDVPGTKITVTFSSEVTVNGLRLPDADSQ